MKKILFYIQIFVVGLICAILHRCPKCWKKLSCIVDDYGGLWDGYGLWYCEKCDGIIKDDFKRNDKINI